MRSIAFILGCCMLSAAYGSHLPPYEIDDQDRSAEVGVGSELTMRAVSLIGTRYRYGGDSPDRGFDCSGFVRYLFRDVLGVELPRTASEISRLGYRIDARDMQPGDLVFYNTMRRSFSHVGIYLGDNKFIHAPSSRGWVRIESMDLDYWKRRFSGARRMPEPQRESPPGDVDENGPVLYSFRND